jgi:hypothetical protein
MTTAFASQGDLAEKTSTFVGKEPCAFTTEGDPNTEDLHGVPSEYDGARAAGDLLLGFSSLRTP